jgi:hypothetical protein
MKPFALILAASVASIFAPGCGATYHTDIVRVTLAAGAATEARSGLKLISVDSDGTAHVEWTDVHKTFDLRPGGPQDQVSLWQLESTDPAAQTARFRAFLCDGGR